MNPDCWHQVKQVFQAALEYEPSEREAYLEKACASDPRIRSEVKDLLRAYYQASSFIEDPAIHATPSLNQAEFLESRFSKDGQRLGAYQIAQELGHGGMGTVYVAIRADDQYQKQVAIKIVSPGMNAAHILERFRNERQVLASLDHPNIARLYDGGTTETSLPYFVMEYIEGRSIDVYCEENHLSIEQVLRLFRLVCDAVHYAHQNLVVHRDIKPGNILITAAGVPKLLDFGIAKILRPELFEEPPVTTITRTGLRAMTPEYASPEQVRGERVTTATDIYSLGVLLYRLLTGCFPYRVKTRQPEEWYRAICEQVPEKPSTALEHAVPATGAAGLLVDADDPQRVSRIDPSRSRELRGDLDNIVLMALRKEPQQRYASVQQFSEDIHRHLGELPVIARKPIWTYRTGKFVQRHKVGVAAAALVAVSLIGGITVASWEARVARQERARAEKRFNDVRRLANSFRFELHDALETLPGSTKARELLVKRALEYLDSLAQEAGSDPSLQQELAVSYERVGDIQGDPYASSLGDTTSALASHRKSLAIRERLIAAHPTDRGARRGVAASHLKIGDILWVTGNWKNALEAYQKARLANEALLAADPLNWEIRDNLAINYLALGDTHAEMSDLQGALENQRKSLDLRQQLARESTGARQRRGVAVSYVKVADMLVRAGEVTEALDNYQKGIRIFEELATVDPTNGRFRQQLANVYQRMGEALLRTNNVVSALGYMKKLVKIDEDLAAADPQDAVARRDLAGSYSSMGNALTKSGADAESLKYDRKALELALALSAQDPQNVQARRDVMVQYNSIGNVLVKNQTLAEAGTNYLKVIGIAEALAAADPGNGQTRSDLAEGYIEMARIKMHLALDDEALELQLKAQKLLESVTAETPTNVDFGSALASLYADLGEVHAHRAATVPPPARQASEQWRQARTWYQKSLEIWLDLQRRGALPGTNASKPVTITRQLEKCDIALSRVSSQ